MDDISKDIKAEKKLKQSENKYHSLVEDMPAMVCRFLPDGILTFVNDAYCLYFNKKREELEGYNFFNFIPKKEQKNVRAHFISLNKRKPMITYEHEVKAPDGSIRCQIWTDRALFDKQGKVREYQSIGQDITEQKKVERELKIKDIAIESSINAIAFANLEGNLTYVNKAFLKMWGYKNKKEVLGKSAIRFWHNWEKPKKVIKILEKTSGWTGELTGKKRDGSAFDVTLSANMIKDESGKPIYMMASFIQYPKQKKMKS